MSEKATTLSVVAERAGVHAATVSRVLSRPELVKPETRSRVEQAVEELGYRPNRAARELAGGSTGMIAVLVPDITNPYFASVVQAAQRSVQQHGHMVAVADTGLTAVEEIRLIETLAPSVDGLILCSPVADSKPLLTATGGQPTVVVNRRIKGFSSVTVDQSGVVLLAAAHLRELGHRRVAVVAGPAGYWSTRQRKRASREAAMPLEDLGSFPPTYEGGRQVAEKLLGSDITAVLAFNDTQALGLIGGLRQMGVSVPGGVSVVGSDDVPFARMADPALTTVAAPLEEVGRTAVALLREMPHRDVALPVELVVRESTVGAR